MHGQHQGSEPYPPPLLDDYLSIARSRGKDALPATALRTGSLATRTLLAYAAVGESGSLDQLVAAARGGAAPTFAPGWHTPAALADLARVVALQNLLPDDQADGMALYDLALDTFGPHAIPPAHQGLHAQLAYQLAKPGRAAQLLDTYRRVPSQLARDLRADLANPFASAAMAGTDEAGWLSRFQGLLPEPHPVLSPPTGTAPFDRLTCGGVPAVDTGPLVSVVVTAYRPGPGIVTAVRSLAAQSWANIEILIVDDASPPEYDRILAHCLSLDDRVRLVRLDTNRGTYPARNAGIDEARGDFVTFQDSDDWSHPVRVERQLLPLLEEASLVATLTDGLRVSDELVINRPGRMHRLSNPSSLMIRKDVVLSRIGYFDGIRKSADSEYLKRIVAAFPTGALRRLRDEVYALIRLTPDSLSRKEIRPGWIHPARVAYMSAYHHWHQQVREGKASPYLPREPDRRPCAAPDHLRRPASQAPRPARYDVVLASDWRKFGGPQKSMLEEIQALTRRGMRVGVAHLEALRFMTHQRKPLCRPIQALINEGTVDRVLLCDEADVSLLVVRYPPVLQFPPGEPSRIRAGQVVILANQAPHERDGTDYRYVPQACTDAARHLFSVEPRWSPQGPEVRGFLEAALPPGTVAPFDMPGIIDIDAWTVDRSRYRMDRPVIGRHSRDNWTKWPGERETLLEVYPDTPDVEVRVMGGGRTARTVLGTPTLPLNWVVYSYDEIGVRSFLNQLDYYVYFPHANMVEAFGRAILEAMATGCVVVLPHQFASTFGDGAVYCEPHQVQEVIRSLHADRASYVDQSRRAQERVRKLYSHDAYLDLISTIIVAP